jgi:hypothetical protein
MGPVCVTVMSGALVLRLDGCSTFWAARLGRREAVAPAGASLARWRGLGWLQPTARAEAPRSA